MKIRLIQAGVGNRGEVFTRLAAESGIEFEWVAIVDPVPSALAKAGELLGLKADRQFSELGDAIAKVPADAVLTCAPPAFHHVHAALAFDHGLHVFTEKPLADTLAHAIGMVRHADKAGKQLLVAQNYRYRPEIATARKLLAEKAVGDFGHGHLEFYIPADFTGSFREKMKFPLLVDMAIHHLDLIRAVTGRNILKVTAQSYLPSWSWYEHDPALKMLLELEGGMPFSYSGDWSARGRSTSWNGTWRLQCSEGSIHLERERVQIVRSERWGKNEQAQDAELTPLHGSSERILMDRFAEAIRTGKPAETSGQDNIWSFGTVMAAVQSIEQKKTIDVAESIGMRK